MAVGFFLGYFVKLICPVINYRIGIDFVEILVDSLCKFFFGLNPDAFQHLFGHFTEETLYEIEPGTVLRCEHKYKAAFRTCCKVVLDLLRLMRRVIIADDSDDITFWINLIEFPQQADKIGTLVNTDYLTGEVEVTETDVAKLKVGQRVLFTFPAYSGGTVEGYVTGWPAIGSVTSRGATVVKVDLRIDDYPEEILPYFSFTGKIEISPTEEYIVVSRYAIGYDNKEPFVVLARGEQKKSVKVQPYGNEYVKVLEGLEGGEVLIQQTTPKTSGQNRNRNNGGNNNNRNTSGGGSSRSGGSMPSGGFPGR